MNKIYYLDNAATTNIFDEEFDLIKSASANFYNPSAAYRQALDVKKSLNAARDEITNLLHGKHGKLYFTSSATESNNTVFMGVHLRAGQTVLISKGEHPSVYESAHRLEKKGVIVKDLPLDKFGKVDFEVYKELVDEKVALISVMHVSNETGAINDIKKLCSYAKQINSKIIFHSDGVQAFGKIDVNLFDLGVDLYSISAHKIYSLRGIAGLWIKKGAIVDALLVGGGQEEGFRSSTENVLGALAFAYASKKVCEDLQKNNAKVKELLQNFVNLLKNSKINTFLTVNSCEDASPYILSLSVAGIKGEVLAHALEEDGVLISTGSACSTKKAGNRTLEAMGKSASDVVGSVRVNFSPYLDYDLEYIAMAFEKNILRFEKNNIKK